MIGGRENKKNYNLRESLHISGIFISHRMLITCQFSVVVKELGWKPGD